MALTVSSDQANLLLDCGEGTWREMLRSGISPLDLSAVMISHLHGDHFFGLPGLIWGMHLRERQKPLVVNGPPGVREALSNWLEISHCRPGFELDIVECGESESWQIADLSITCAAGTHGRIETRAYRVAPTAPAISHAIGPATDPGSETAALPRGAFVYSGDTGPDRGIEKLATGATLLAHDSSWWERDQSTGQNPRHCTALEAAGIARRAGVGRLLLIHTYPSWADEPDEILAAAREIFPQTAIPADGDSYTIAD